jgi:hypothetical protein
MMRTPVDQNAIRSLFRRKKELFGLVYEFNLLPAEYIHRTWINTFISPILFEKIIQSKKGITALSQWILTQNNLSQDYYYDFIKPLFRLALLPSEMIKKLSLYCGIALNHKYITAVINKHEKEKIIEKIGHEGYRFGVKTAPLLLGNYKSFTEALSAKEDIKAFLERCGTIYFLESFSRAPRSLFKRLVFKLPKDIIQNQDLSFSSQEENLHWLFLRRILKHAIDPKWHHLFS